MDTEFATQHAYLHDGLMKCKEAIMKCATSENPEAVVSEIFGLNLKKDTEEQPNIDEAEETRTSPAFSQLLATVEGLLDEWSKLDKKVKTHQNETDQYSRMNSLLIKKLTNIPNTRGFEFARYVADELNRRFRNLDHPIHYTEIDAAHPLPNKDNPDSEPTTIIVKFVSRNTRNNIFYNKWQLKYSNDNVSITEHLTSENSKLLKKAKEKFGAPNVWTDQCRIMIFVDGKKERIKSMEDLENLAVPEDHLEKCELARKKHQEKRRSQKKSSPRKKHQQSGPSYQHQGQGNWNNNFQYHYAAPTMGMYNPNYHDFPPPPDPGNGRVIR